MLELLSMPDGLYRMLTLQEQNALAAQAQAAMTVSESATSPHDVQAQVSSSAEDGIAPKSDTNGG
jgi:hypothetical protein